MVAARTPEIIEDKARRLASALQPWVVSPIEHHEVEAIACFYAGFEDESRPVEFWRDRLKLWWHSNPAFTKDWPLGVKLTAGGRVVGVLSAVPVRVKAGGRNAVGAALTTWRVEKDHRSGSIGMFEAVLQAHAGRPVFDSTPTPGVIRLLKHYRFHQPREHFQATRLICNAWRLIARACGSRAAPLAASHFYIDGRPATQVEASSLVDALWASHHAQFDDVGIKDAAYFNWYCHAGRTHGRFGLVVTDLTGRASGMAVCLDMGNGVAWLVDMWCDFTTPAAAAQIIARARQHATRLEFHCLWVPHFQPAIASACGSRGSIRQMPVNAFFKMPSAYEKSSSSCWTIAVGDFGF